MSQAPFANPTDAYKGRNVMRRNFLLGCAALLVFASAGFGAAQNQSSITGTVTASQLASTGMTSVGTWEKKLNCHGEADCARVLVDTRIVRDLAPPGTGLSFLYPLIKKKMS